MRLSLELTVWWWGSWHDWMVIPKYSMLFSQIVWSLILKFCIWNNFVFLVQQYEVRNILWNEKRNYFDLRLLWLMKQNILSWVTVEWNYTRKIHVLKTPTFNFPVAIFLKEAANIKSLYHHLNWFKDYLENLAHFVWSINKS